MRLIDADALKKQYIETDKWGKVILILDVVNAPTIDAEPVKHGKWEIVKLNNYNAVACSECGEPSVAETPYCSYCGAKMERREP